MEAFKEGLGFEAASIGELRMSQRANSSAFVVYDSPLKTMSELTEALELGAAVRQTRECWFVLAHFFVRCR